jgi:hypothetical protein
MKAGPLRSQQRGPKILEENKIPITEVVMGPSVGWGRIWSAYSLRSSLRRLR